MATSRKGVGAEGEELAVAFLKKRGWMIEAVNWRCRLGEVDIIAGCEGLLCFIEVKTRRSSRFGLGGEALTPDKCRRLARLAALYCQAKGRKKTAVEFGVVSVTLDDAGPRIDFIRHAFEAVGLY